MLPTKPTVYFYRKHTCPLCDEMAHELRAFQTTSEVQFTITERDIDQDPRWQKTYAETVPVLVVGDAEICYAFFEEEPLRAALACA